MAKDGRTEKATPRRRKERKEKGSLAKSKELTNFINLLGLVLLIVWFGEWIIKEVISFQRMAFDILEQEIELLDFIWILAKKMGQLILIIGFFGLIFVGINYVIQVKFLFSLKIIKPDFKRINPKNYFKNLFSRRTIVEIIKSLFIFSILSTVVFFELKGEVKQLSEMILIDWIATIKLLWDVFESVLMKILAVFGIIAILDFVYQKWEFEESIKMKKEEVKDEYKNTQGNPEVKQRQRQFMMQMLKQEVASKIPDSTVVVTNPTHYSVAIRYERDKDAAPVVTAKGIDHLALYIRQLAKEHNVPIYEAPPLARELYGRTEPDEFIPKELYEPVIMILIELSNEGKIDL